MMNLHDGLARIAGPDAEPTSEQVAADLARGRTALRRRRTVQAAGGSVFMAAALAAVIVAGTGIASGPSGPSGPEAAGDRPSTSSPATGPTALVAYQGEQPKGFTLDKVPEGWVLQGADEYGITIAPKGAPDNDPHSFAGKIMAQLQEFGPGEDIAGGKKLTINGKEAVLTKMLDQTTGHALFVNLGENRWMIVQVWDGLGWGEQQVVEFASGIHVDDSAKVTHG
ncbi:hypothetical protein FHR83_001282 [Actinoplanes campanulatus]|uniref:Uncharacterized protein n=1 Tax=Actinoplanes campanulatus TaxID=113559 RepID=A0A7W5ACD5_9ACTN|nr:hypothetical protein [Actinoplanes campanulatus]MBB3093633.1 hypothetical protein [Actinoplanes campanulatus]GGN04636.1 hypothetical protein GCM10010109_11540 [Actinoplanes campanulatus]GID35290.1 hypothetical protein Aca09nite_17960 [Actinoplanes campanulatus]